MISLINIQCPFLHLGIVEKSKNIALKFNNANNNVTMVSEFSADRSSSGSQSNQQSQKAAAITI